MQFEIEKKMIRIDDFTHIEFCDASGEVTFRPLLDRNGVWRFPPFDEEQSLLLRVSVARDAVSPFFVSVSHAGWHRSLTLLTHNSTQMETLINLNNKGEIRVQIYEAILRKCCYRRWVKGVLQHTVNYAYAHD